MKKKYLIFFALLIVALAVMSGCGKQEQSLEGKNIVTFELQGGTLDYGTASTNTKINYAYDPGTYVLDPVEFNNYNLYRSGYVFTGWYTSETCEPSTKWDFDSKTIDVEKLTLYAGWKKAIVYSYTVYYIGENDTPVSLGKYEVSEGEKFEDWRKYANGREGYTPFEFYSDAALTTLWDHDYAHPGGETDLDVPVYAKYIEGVWELVDNASALRAALRSNKNIYLTANVDFSGEEFLAKSDASVYSGKFNGNGYTVSNFTVPQRGTILNPFISLFNELGEGAEIKDVTFSGITFNTADNLKSLKAAALAKSATGAKITNVTVSGKLVTDYEGELSTLNSAFVDEESTAELQGFTASVTVEKKTQG